MFATILVVIGLLVATIDEPKVLEMLPRLGLVMS
jgi:hypothetical protein